jgi:hypothetical protein
MSLLKRLWRWYADRPMKTGYTGNGMSGVPSPDPMRRDPTYGRIASDIQEWVEREWKPSSLGQRVALENTIQAHRDRGDRLAIDGNGPRAQSMLWDRG